MTRTKPYRAGDLFLVPLASGGYGVGLVARILRPHLLLGYFFRPRRMVHASLAAQGHLARDDVVLVEMFGDLGLVNGTWSVLGSMPGWDAADWPMPSFGLSQDVGSETYYRIEVDEANPLVPKRQVPIGHSEFALLPEFGAAGHVWIEERLDRLLEPVTDIEAESAADLLGQPTDAVDSWPLDAAAHDDAASTANTDGLLIVTLPLLGYWATRGERQTLGKLEDEVAKSLREIGEVDGNEIGAGEWRILIRTRRPDDALRMISPLLDATRRRWFATKSE